MTYTHENDPVHVVMTEEYYFWFGPYNPRTGLATMEYLGSYTHPTDVHILTFSLSPNSKAWSDEGYHAYCGPITVIRIQHGITITGIQSRFGAQWSTGFWSNVPGKTLTQVNLNQNEYIRAVAVSMLDTLDSIMFITNIQSYGPVGVDKGGKNETLVSRCGQVHHFWGYLKWDDGAQVYKTFSFGATNPSNRRQTTNHYMNLLNKFTDVYMLCVCVCVGGGGGGGGGGGECYLWKTSIIGCYVPA